MRSTVFHIGDMIKFLWSKTEVCVDASDKVCSLKRLLLGFFLPLLTINQTSVWIHATDFAESRNNGDNYDGLTKTNRIAALFIVANMSVRPVCVRRLCTK